ncbi:MAG TPA: peptidoglycan-binding domain-containing protein [Candidatus Acidoferrum sp.]|nr:peptidoglycan-binding domain-containing protein [Candidatus Acidoferrum sp.]
MRIRLRNATHLASSLLLAAGLGAFPGLATAQITAGKKHTSSAAHRSTHGKKSSSKRGGRRERGQQAPTPDRISEIQQALAKDGSYTGTPSGNWDNSTQEALRKFQESHGLTPTGNLDAKSLQQLGLGSSTAGVAPPGPSNTPSKLTSSTAQTSQHPN